VSMTYPTYRLPKNSTRFDAVFTCRGRLCLCKTDDKLCEDSYVIYIDNGYITVKKRVAGFFTYDIEHRLSLDEGDLTEIDPDFKNIGSRLIDIAKDYDKDL
jgi:hypothetical protein